MASGTGYAVPGCSYGDGAAGVWVPPGEVAYDWYSSVVVAEAAVWLGRLAALDRKRARFQDMAAEGHMTFEELGERLREVDAGREAAERELAEVEGRRSRIEELERDRDALLERYAGMVPEALETLSPQERHRVYRMLRLKVVAHPDDTMEVQGVFGDRFLGTANVLQTS